MFQEYRLEINKREYVHLGNQGLGRVLFEDIRNLRPARLHIQSTKSVRGMGVFGPRTWRARALRSESAARSPSLSCTDFSIHRLRSSMRVLLPLGRVSRGSAALDGTAECTGNRARTSRSRTWQS